MKGCPLCKRKSTLLLYRVRRRRQPGWFDVEARKWRTDGREPVAQRVSRACADRQECREYCRERYRKQREASEKRGGRLILCEAPAKDKPYEKGDCSWCGKPIVLADPTDYRRRARTRHYGDEHETGDRNCTAEFLNSYAFTARELIENRGDPECVDCKSAGPWEAEHDQPLWDGGEHVPENIVRRCVDCHRVKSKAEAKERAARRRKARRPSTQPELLEVAG